MEVFELATTSLNIPSQSHMFAEVTFTPQTIQLYNAVFEVAMEGASRCERRPYPFAICLFTLSVLKVCLFFPHFLEFHLLQNDPTIQEQAAGV